MHLLAKAVRFEHGPEVGGETGCTQGLRILKVRDEDRALYVGFLRTLAPLERRPGERERWRQEVLRLATSGSEMSSGGDALTPQDVARAFESFPGRNQPGGRS